VVKVVVLHEASEELSDAAVWYEGERAGLGADLLAEAARAIKQIAASPSTWPLVRRSHVVRRFPLTRFPFSVYYAVCEDHVRVFAFGHTSRKPGYWRYRLGR
jgi:toxin ParE1/3/4